MKIDFKDYFQYGLAIVVVIGFILLMYFTITHDIPKSNERLVDQLWGAWIMAFGTVLNYFFSSNKDSAKKTEMLYNSTPIDNALNNNQSLLNDNEKR